MGKNMQKHNIITLYVRKKYQPLYKKFGELVKKDEDMIELRYKKDFGLISIAIFQLMYQYVMEKEPTFKLEWDTQLK